MRAQNDSLSNDSVHVQYNDSVDSIGGATAQIGTTSSTDTCFRMDRMGRRIRVGAGPTTAGAPLGPNIFFAATGTHTLRVQQREDGADHRSDRDQPGYVPDDIAGRAENDTTILPASVG